MNAQSIDFTAQPDRTGPTGMTEQIGKISAAAELSTEAP
jgi:hypothetical protein